MARRFGNQTVFFSLSGVTEKDIYYSVPANETSFINRARNIGCLDEGAFKFSYKCRFVAVKINPNLVAYGMIIGRVSGGVQCSFRPLRINSRSVGSAITETSRVSASGGSPGSDIGVQNFTAKVSIGNGKNRGNTVFTFDIRYSSISNQVIIDTYLDLKDGDELAFLKPPTPLQRQLEASCPRIFILAATEVLYRGGNLSQVLLRVNNGSSQREYLRRPPLTCVVGGTGCTLSQKIFSMNTQENVDITEGVVTYGLLRYFLWYLAEGEWCIRILAQSMTRKFLKGLASSEYACWVPYITNSDVAKYSVYFIL